ncbi:MAG: hypothetical protein VX278_13430, partial [Myxococcota bacterium]|nr:hypothetical protein [Myxococcota bacterium]
MPRVLISLLFGFACRSDDGLKAYNTDPTASILSHADGEEILSGYDITFRGQVSDLNHAEDDLTVLWSTDLRNLCPESDVDFEGKTSCRTSMEEGETQVRLEVVDPAGAASMTSISIVVLPTEPPEAVILSPVATESYYSSQLIRFAAQLSDAEDDPTDLQYTWTSSVDGDLPITTDPQSNGEIEGYAALSAGQHAISLLVEDTAGKTTTESLAIIVGGENTEPTCEITEPEDGFVEIAGQSILFRGVVDDPDINNSLLSIEWSSNRDGIIDTTSPNTAGELSFATDILSSGNHTITLRVVDDAEGLC